MTFHAACLRKECYRSTSCHRQLAEQMEFGSFGRNRNALHTFKSSHYRAQNRPANRRSCLRMNRFRRFEGIDVASPCQGQRDGVVHSKSFCHHSRASLRSCSDNKSIPPHSSWPACTLGSRRVPQGAPARLTSSNRGEDWEAISGVHRCGRCHPCNTLVRIGLLMATAAATSYVSWIHESHRWRFLGYGGVCPRCGSSGR